MPARSFSKQKNMTAIYTNSANNSITKKLIEDRENYPITFFKKATIKNGEPAAWISNLKIVLTQYLPGDPKLKAISAKALEKLSIAGKDKKFKAWRAANMPVFVSGNVPRRGEPTAYPNLQVFDIDGLDVPVSFLEDDLKNIPFILAAFPSQTGTGLRIFVWTNADQQSHKRYNAAICKELSRLLNIQLKSEIQENNVPHIDDGSTDAINHIWFANHVPEKEIYTNWESETFCLPEVQKSSTTKQKRQQGGGYIHEFSMEEKFRDMVRQIVDQRMDLTPGKTRNWFKIGVSIANEFGEAGREDFHQVSQFHPGYNRKDTDKQYSECLAKDKGKIKIDTFFKMYGDAGIKVDTQRLLEARRTPPAPPATVTDKRDQERENLSVSEELEAEGEPETFFKFYTIKQDGQKIDIKVNFLLLVELLKKLGFRRYDIDGEFFIVQVKDNVVRECSKQELIDTFESYILDFPEENFPDDVTKEILLNKIYGSIATYFSDHVLGRLRPSKPIKFNDHQKDRAFFYFQNGYVEIGTNGSELKPYSTLRNHIWDNQILKRKFKKSSYAQYKNFSFVQFVKNIANAWKTHPLYKRENTSPDLARFESFQSIIGYLLHAYFEGELKAVIFTDSRLDDEGEAFGRSGKTLLLKALGYLLNKDYKGSKTYVEINGKDFDSGRNFKYQELGLDTKLVHINDVKRNFDFEDLFNDITEGIKRERKNESPSIVKTKMALSTNRTMKIRGASAKGRSIEVELAEYYDDLWTPKKEFGEWFFTEWTPAQWAQFDSFMIDCVQYYFRHGIKRPDTINLNERKKLEETSLEFTQWMEDKEPYLVHGERIDKKELFEDFRNRYPDFQKDWFSQRTFTKWVTTYCEYDDTYERVESKRSNGVDYFIFWHNLDNAEK